MPDDVVEHALGNYVLRLEGAMIEVVNRIRGETLRMHVNHAAAKLDHRRDGSLRVTFGYPKRWVYGMPGGPGADLIDDDLQPNAAGNLTIAPTLEPTIRGFLATAAARRTQPLPGSPLP